MRRTLLPPLLIALIIFILSSFSADQSSEQSGLIVSLVTNIVPEATNIDILTKIIRKLAHFTEYASLGFFTARVFKSYQKSIFLAVPTCAAYATTDELHQLFVPGRSCELLDIFIDTAGAFIGVLLYYFYCKIRRSMI